MKIRPTPEREWFSKKSANHSKGVNFIGGGGELREGRKLSLSELHKKKKKKKNTGEIHSFGVIFNFFFKCHSLFAMIFTRFGSNFHSFRVFLRFSMIFTRMTISLFFFTKRSRFESGQINGSITTSVSCIEDTDLYIGPIFFFFFFFFYVKGSTVHKHL